MSVRSRSTGDEKTENLNPCPPEFLVRFAVLKHDELLFSHIALCARCTRIYETFAGALATDGGKPRARQAPGLRRLRAPIHAAVQKVAAALHALF